MQYRAALFDMDGTLLDSMGVWAKVDVDFFALRGIPVPSDYGAALSGKSFIESAIYTKERFSLPESTEEIIAEWNSLCRREYAHNVRLKPGAVEYLRLLKRCGVKIAAATALPNHLFVPALENNGIAHLFDAYTSTEETGTGKITGDVYRLAAKKLGVDAADCIVFEDILEGALGAHAAGMRACNVYDRYADHKRDAITAENDFNIRDFTDFRSLPLPPLPWKRAVIVPAYIEGTLPAGELRDDDCVIAADRGFLLCRDSGISPDFCLGDFDSLLPGELPPLGARILPAEKDDTDTAAAVRLASALGLTDMLLLGGIGGRLDHTLANLQLMRFAHSIGARLSIRDSHEQAELLTPGTHVLRAPSARFSLFAFTPRAEHLSITGAKYPLTDGLLTDSFPLGISNETLSEGETEIRFSDGLLLLVRSHRR